MAAATATGAYQAWSPTERDESLTAYARASAEYDRMVATVCPEEAPPELKPGVEPEECAPLRAELGEVELQEDVLYIWLDLHEGEMKVVILPEVAFVRDNRATAGTTIATLTCQKLEQVVRIRFLSPTGHEVLVVENMSSR